MEHQLSNLKSFVRDTIISNPTLENEIKSLFILCLDEIEEGGSVDNEVSLCIRDIEGLILDDDYKSTLQQDEQRYVNGK